jgi:hypothetical protein
MYLVWKTYFRRYSSSNYYHSSCNVHGLYTILRWPGINMSREENIGIREIGEPMSKGTKEAGYIIIACNTNSTGRPASGIEVWAIDPLPYK